MIKAAVGAALAGALAATARARGFELPDGGRFNLEHPRVPAHGDLACNAALALAKRVGQPPLALADAIASHLSLEGPLAAVCVAPPGFINLRLSDDWLVARPFAILDDGERYAASELAALRGLADARLREQALDLTGDAVARFLALLAPAAPLDFALARRETAENAGFYVRYTHARLSSVLRLAAEQGCKPAERPGAWPLEPDERALLVALSSYRGELCFALETREPARMARYALTLAAAFHQFYAACRVVGEPLGPGAFRLVLVDATRGVLGSLLSRGLDVDAPAHL